MQNNIRPTAVSVIIIGKGQHQWVLNIIRGNDFEVDIPNGAVLAKVALGRCRLD